MAARDLKLTAVLVDKVSSGLAKAGQDWKKAIEEPAKALIKQQEAANKKIIDNDEKLSKERIRLQRASIVLMEKQAAEAASVSMRAGENTLRASRSQADAALKIQRQAAIAESALVLNKFDRMMAKEKQIHAHRLADLKGNDAAMEAEIRRHNAVIGRMSMDKANFPNTPFQQLLGHLNKVTGMMGVQLPQSINTASSSMAGASGVSAGLAVGMAAAGASALALGAGIKFAYGEARESIDADKKLELVIRSTGRGAEFTANELSKLADQYQETTDYSDEAVKGAEAILLRYDAIGKDVFPKALRAAADLGTETGDLAGAAFNLGLALQMPEEAGRKLTSMGIKLTETEKQMLQQFADTNETVKAQEFILDKVAKAYGGAAETMSHDTTKLINRIGELAEKVGNTLVPIVDFAASAINDLITPDAPKKAKEYWDAQKLGALGFVLSAQDAADMMNKTGAKSPEKQAPVVKAKTDAQIKAEKEASERIRAEKEDDAKAAAQFQIDQFKAQKKEEYTVARLNREAIAADEERALKASELAATESLARKNAAKAATVQTEQTSAAGNPLALLAIQQREELIAVEGNETAITEIKRRHEMERRALTLMTSQATAAGVASNLAKVAGQYKSFSGVAKKAAQVQNAMDTYAGATAAYKSAAGIPLVGWLMAPIAAAAAVAGGMANASKINSQGFEQGGWTGNGGRTDVAGVVHGGEMVWSQADVRRAGGRQAAENIRQGNNSTSITAPINIVINGNADDRTVRAMGKTIEQTLKDHAWRTEQVKYRGITA
jgi:hypothetical protein